MTADRSELSNTLDPGGTLTVYPGVHHNFDAVALTLGVRHFDHWLEYNEPAAKDAEEKTRAFLAAHLAGTSPAVGNRR